VANDVIERRRAGFGVGFYRAFDERAIARGRANEIVEKFRLPPMSLGAWFRFP
jgi:hypothetical protein